MHLNWIDYAIIGVIILSTVISFFRGFLREAVSLVVWIAGIAIALRYANVVQLGFKTWFASPSVRYIVAFMSLFLLVFIIGIIINMLLHALIHKTGLTITDRILGFVFGAVRGLLIVAILLMFVSIGSVKDGTALAQSSLAPEFKPAVVWLNEFLPQHTKQFSRWVLNKGDSQNQQLYPARKANGQRLQTGNPK